MPPPKKQQIFLFTNSITIISDPKFQKKKTKQVGNREVPSLVSHLDRNVCEVFPPYNTIG